MSEKFTTPLTQDDLKNRIYFEIQENLSGINLNQNISLYDDAQLQEDLRQLRFRVDYLLSLKPPIQDDVVDNVVYVLDNTQTGIFDENINYLDIYNNDTRDKGDGLSWGTAFLYFQDARQYILDLFNEYAANAPTTNIQEYLENFPSYEIWVAGNQDSEILNLFATIPNLSIYGGFLGNEQNKNQRPKTSLGYTNNKSIMFNLFGGASNYAFHIEGFDFRGGNRLRVLDARGSSNFDAVVKDCSISLPDSNIFYQSESLNITNKILTGLNDIFQNDIELAGQHITNSMVRVSFALFDACNFSYNETIIVNEGADYGNGDDAHDGLILGFDWLINCFNSNMINCEFNFNRNITGINGAVGFNISSSGRTGGASTIIAMREFIRATNLEFSNINISLNHNALNLNGGNGGNGQFNFSGGDGGFSQYGIGGTGGTGGDVSSGLNRQGGDGGDTLFGSPGLAGASGTGGSGPPNMPSVDGIVITSKDIYGFFSGGARILCEIPTNYEYTATTFIPLNP